MCEKWVYVNLQSYMDDKGYRVSTKNWNGPGWYLQKTYSKLCPRGCCYDNCIEWSPAKEVVESIKEEMILVCKRLKEAKEKAKNA